jgi:hypothetical protein
VGTGGGDDARGRDRNDDVGVPPESKICARCGRTMAWRKSWARNWEQVRYCSEACRRRKLTATDIALERAILDLLDARTGTICPSEAARAVDPEGWRDLMEPARQAARRLVARDLVEITQGGRAVDPSTAKGPIRVRRVTHA